MPIDQIIGYLVINFGWISFALVFLWGASQMWLNYIRVQWGSKQKFIVLAIDIPKGNTQSPKAVENIFAYLGGAHTNPNLIDNWWIGIYQLDFSFEIVSIEGYTQFIIHTPELQRNLVESAIYAQYPDAEITEVDDYTQGMPNKFPDPEWDIWGAEFIYVRHHAYPIKTYEEFIHNFGEPEEQFKDPMASLMDLCSSLKKGEQLWMQLIITPIGFEWMDVLEKEAQKVLGRKMETSTTIVDSLIDALVAGMSYFSELIFSLWGDVEEKKDDKQEDRFLMMNLMPRDKKRIEAIHNKISKLGFNFKLRFIYWGKKEVMNKPKGAGGFVGFIKQFAALDLNNLKPDLDITGTSVNYFMRSYRLNKRKTNLVVNYKGRDSGAGRDQKIMNIEELATLWHFPVEAVVKAPLIQKAPGRKSEPPMSLPYFDSDTSKDITDRKNTMEFFGEDKAVVKSGEVGKNKTEEFVPEKVEAEDNPVSQADRRGSPPSNLPFA